jgi:hypothetical protein
MKYWHPHLPFGQHIAVSTLVLYVNNVATRFIITCRPLVSSYVTMYHVRLCPSMVCHFAQRIDALMYQRYDYEYRLGENKIIKYYKLKYLALILLCWNIRHNLISFRVDTSFLFTRCISYVLMCSISLYYFDLFIFFFYFCLYTKSYAYLNTMINYF